MVVARQRQRHACVGTGHNFFHLEDYGITTGPGGVGVVWPGCVGVQGRASPDRQKGVFAFHCNIPLAHWPMLPVCLLSIHKATGWLLSARKADKIRVGWGLKNKRVVDSTFPQCGENETDNLRQGGVEYPTYNTGDVSRRVQA